MAKFHVKSDKKQKIFFCTPVSKFQEILKLNIYDEAKQIYPKKRKKILRRDTLRISIAVIRKFNLKKGVPYFKFLPPVYLHIIKIDIK